MMTTTTPRLLPMASSGARPGPALESYNLILVAFSGGKDSLACVLHLLEMGVSPERIELHHHDVDGREGSRLMDWPVTRAYTEAIARELGLTLTFSWKVGGFEREMLRNEAATGNTRWTTREGQGREAKPGPGKVGTRMRFPQVSADLSVRWCSAYLKIDIMDRMLRGDPRFQGKRILVVTGERAEESAGRAGYAAFEPHRADLRDGRKFKRHIDHWRPVHAWDEGRVWAIIERHRIRPHPAYEVGFGRTSCLACIFGSPSQWATIRERAPERFEAIAHYESAFGVTIRRDGPIGDVADKGRPYASTDDAMWAIALGDTYPIPARTEAGAWRLPAGAFGESAGPT